MNQYNTNIAKKIMELRKKQGYTQEQLAERLGITFQAISKWENGNSCPDITLLPLLAEVFQVSIDELFGEVVSQKQVDLPWGDDERLRIVVYKGKRLVEHSEPGAEKLAVEYKGKALNIESRISITCQDVEGTVKAGVHVNARDIGGSVQAGVHTNCRHVGGSIQAGVGINCESVVGEAKAGVSITCKDIGGNAQAGEKIEGNKINGNVTAQMVKCESIEGDVTAREVKCTMIQGNVYYEKNKERV